MLVKLSTLSQDPDHIPLLDLHQIPIATILVWTVPLPLIVQPLEHIADRILCVFFVPLVRHVLELEPLLLLIAVALITLPLGPQRALLLVLLLLLVLPHSLPNLGDRSLGTSAATAMGGFARTTAPTTAPVRRTTTASASPAWMESRNGLAPIALFAHALATSLGSAR